MPDAPAAMHAWLDTQSDALAQRVQHWSDINSGSANAAGLAAMLDALEPPLAALADTVERIGHEPTTRIDDAGQLRTHPAGTSLRARRRPEAPTQALLLIHFDTVYPADHPFQRVSRIDDPDFGPALHGPGVADAKGGLVVLLAALDAFERHASDPMKQTLGWTVVLNPDEETGSFASRGLLEAEAKRATFGMVYEPALPDGDLIGPRKGSGNFAVVVRGKAAHAGREFWQGVNAVTHAARLATRLEDRSDRNRGTTVNVARLAGGGPENVVPELAVLRFNVRVADPDAQRDFERHLQHELDELQKVDGLSVERHGRFNNPPKPMSDGTAAMFDTLRRVGDDPAVDVRFNVQASGGVCDGNKLAAVGLPVVDTLGPVGRDIHSDRETLAIGSLVSRAKVSAGLLWEAAHGRLAL
jgi:glutamate carboxypeptidase